MKTSSKPKRYVNNFIKKTEFAELELGDRLETRFMGKCATTSLPFRKEELDADGNTIKNDNIKVKFYTGPWSTGKWEGKELTLVRQQILKRII